MKDKGGYGSRLLGILWVVLCCGIWFGTEAQIVSKRPRISSQQIGMSEIRNGIIPITELAPLNVDSMLTVSQNSAAYLRGAELFAQKRLVNINLVREGLQQQTDDGRTLIRYAVKVPNAKGLNFFFDKFFLPEDSYLTIHALEKSESSIGSFGTENNSESKALPTMSIEGSVALIELDLPSSLNGQEALLHLSDVNAEFRSQPRQSNPGTLTCSPNAICLPQYQRESKAVVSLIVNGTVRGSGAMINNTAEDGRPLLATASHVLLRSFFDLDKDYDHLAKTVVAYFGHQTTDCEGLIAPQVQQSVAGTKLLTIFEKGDMCLLELNQKPPVEYNAYLGGWNKTEANPEGPFVCVHHPNGMPKRLAMTSTQVVKGWPPSLGYPHPIVPNLYYWWVKKWDLGVTMPGSSGSPLYDAEGYMIGFLTAGASECSSPFDDVYTGIGFNWNNRKNTQMPTMGEVLDPSGTGVVKLAGRPLYKEAKEVNRWSNVMEGYKAEILKSIFLYTQKMNPQPRFVGERLVVPASATPVTLHGLTTTLHIPTGLKKVPSIAVPYTIYKKTASGSLESLLHENVRLDDVVVSNKQAVHTTEDVVARGTVEVYSHFSEAINLSSGDEILIAYEIGAMTEGIALLTAPTHGSKNHLVTSNDANSWNEWPEEQQGISLCVHISYTGDKLGHDDEPIDAKDYFRMRYTGGDLLIQFQDAPTGEVAKKHTITLYTLLGQRLVQSKTTSQSVILPVGAYPPGIYIIHIEDSEGNKHSKKILLNSK
ncbi:MAG: T9SS type A sorting domain-containing protein [Porphyromonas sp.]|nr:T9SS type A sorting domain-containing protein [Porphyromonas sp.]